MASVESVDPTMQYYLCFGDDNAGKKTIMKIVEEESTKCRFITNAEGHDISMTGVLVVSANDDEFESSIGNGRILQILTRIKRETQEIKCILVLLNKLDDPTVQWDEKSYNQRIEVLEVLLQNSGFKREEYEFWPCSGRDGRGLKEPANVRWNDKKLSFISYIESLPFMIASQDESGDNSGGDSEQQSEPKSNTDNQRSQPRKSVTDKAEITTKEGKSEAKKKGKVEDENNADEDWDEDILVPADLSPRGGNVPKKKGKAAMLIAAALAHKRGNVPRKKGKGAKKDSSTTPAPDKTTPGKGKGSRVYKPNYTNCRKCGKPKSVSNIEKHLKVCGQQKVKKEYKCKDCQKCFPTPSKLDLHNSGQCRVCKYEVEHVKCNQQFNTLKGTSFQDQI